MRGWKFDMKKLKQTSITLHDYDKLMDKIIKKNLPFEDKLTKMLEEGSKYIIVKEK